MIKPEVLDAMVAAGCSAEQIAAVVKASMATDTNAARQARYRSRGGGKITHQMRLEVFERDGFICLDCGTEENLCCDHVVPVSKGGETSFENLQTLCIPCNSRKKDRTRKFEKRADNRGQSRTTADVQGPPSPLSDKENPPAPPKEINSPPLPPAVMIGADDFESKILEAAGEMIHPHGAIVVGPILSLITAGADLELDVLPTIRATVARMAHPARSWSYFVPAIQAAFDRRIAAGKWEPSTRAQPPPRLTPHQQRHKAAMNAFDRQLGIKPDDEPASNIIDLEGRDFRSL